MLGERQKKRISFCAVLPVEQHRAGKPKAFNALVGQVMKVAKGKANPQQVNELLRAKLAG